MCGWFRFRKMFCPKDYQVKMLYNIELNAIEQTSVDLLTAQHLKFPRKFVFPNFMVKFTLLHIAF